MLKYLCVNLINMRTFKSGNHEIILVDCLSKYEVGNLDKNFGQWAGIPFFETLSMVLFN